MWAQRKWILAGAGVKESPSEMLNLESKSAV